MMEKPRKFRDDVPLPVDKSGIWRRGENSGVVVIVVAIVNVFVVAGERTESPAMPPTTALSNAPPLKDLGPSPVFVVVVVGGGFTVADVLMHDTPPSV